MQTQSQILGMMGAVNYSAAYGWIVFSFIFVLASLASSISYALVYHDWNASAWGLVCGILCIVSFSERLYRLLCEKNKQLPHDHTHVILFFGIASLTASFTGLIIYAFLLVTNDRTFFPDGYALSILWTFLTFFWAIVVIFYIKNFHVFRKLSPGLFKITLFCCFIGFIYGIAGLLLFTLYYPNTPAAVCTSITSFIFAVIGIEFKYREYCLQRNRATHNHLQLLLLIGILGMLLGKIGCIILIGAGLRNDEGWFLEGYFVGGATAGILEFAGFSLMWTVWHFRFTEQSVDLFFKSSISESAPLMDGDISETD